MINIAIFRSLVTFFIEFKLTHIVASPNSHLFRAFFTVSYIPFFADRTFSNFLFSDRSPLNHELDFPISMIRSIFPLTLFLILFLFIRNIHCSTTAVLVVHESAPVGHVIGYIEGKPSLSSQSLYFIVFPDETTEKVRFEIFFCN